MGYHYRESGDNGWDILVVTKKGMEEGGLPKGIILLTGILYAERNGAGRKWINDVRASGIIHVSVAKHCDKETELTHISKDGFVNRFGFSFPKRIRLNPASKTSILNPAGSAGRRYWIIRSLRKHFSK